MISPLRTARAVSSSPQGHCSKIWGCLCTAQGMILHWEVLSCEQLEFWGSNLKFWGIRFFVGLRFESVPISVRWCPLSFCPSVLLSCGCWDTALSKQPALQLLTDTLVSSWAFSNCVFSSCLPSLCPCSIILPLVVAKFGLWAAQWRSFSSPGLDLGCQEKSTNSVGSTKIWCFGLQSEAESRQKTLKVCNTS